MRTVRMVEGGDLVVVRQADAERAVLAATHDDVGKERRRAQPAHPLHLQEERLGHRECG
tara:strand:- start:217 stop:393 length:177 start_codon:yes stop_codon:yes gene_type:complete